MNTRLVRVGPDPERDPIVAEAAELLKRGELVAFPTETVYGLGADATSVEACERVFAVKGRPADNPLIVHVASAGDLGLAAETGDPRVARLADAFWPGPLTLVLPARPEVRRAACRGLDTVAVRVPGHPVALALLRLVGIPVAAPSANLSGLPSPTRAADVQRDLVGRIPLILDGGPCIVGLESTVLDLSGGEAAILRPGAVTAEQIEAVLGTPVGSGHGEALRRSPGTRHRHYAPRARVIIMGSHVSPGAATRLARALGSVAYLGKRQELIGLAGVASPEAARDPAHLAPAFHALLRDLDDAGVAAVIADDVPDESAHRALRDRLHRASSDVVLDDEAAARLTASLPPLP